MGDPHWSCGQEPVPCKLFLLWLCFLRLARTWKESGALITTKSIHIPNTHHALVISREHKPIMGKSTNLPTSEHLSPRWRRLPADHGPHFLWFRAHRPHSPASLAAKRGCVTEFQPTEWRWKWWAPLTSLPIRNLHVSPLHGRLGRHTATSAEPQEDRLWVSDLLLGGESSPKPAHWFWWLKRWSTTMILACMFYSSLSSIPW